MCGGITVQVIAQVAIESAAPSFDKAYSYLVPEDMRAHAVPGCRVQVPFGRADKKLVGLILSCDEAGVSGKLKPLLKVLDDEPVLNAEGLGLLFWLREHTFCTWFDALRTLIPRKISDDKLQMARATEGFSGKLTSRQREVYDFILSAGEVSLRDIREHTGASPRVIENLEKKSAIEVFARVRPRNPYSNLPGLSSPTLSTDQRQAVDILSGSLRGKNPKPRLLYGVTGSGKTQVFLELIAQVVSGGKSVIVMVPEISLTSQTVRQVQSRFGSRVAALHSGLSAGERMDEWKRIKNGGADVVVGTRSAVFAPLSDIGLIVIDEEQEHTYKSEKSPRYHARDAAAARCRYHGAMLLLCSATPSVESYHRARQAEIYGGLVTLAERFGDAILPDVYLVDMNDRENLSNSRYLSDTLLSEIRYNVERGEQSILLLNRRGYSTVIKCTSCGEPAGCPNCSVSMTYHMATDSLLCHYCGFSRKRAEICGACGSELLRYDGAGTQKLEQELNMLFPNAKIARMDMDTTTAKFSHDRIFAAFEAGEYDILIGTQMVAKGLNFPRVTLVGVLSADQSLYADDFRGFEKAFALITQVVGRSGRGKSPGRAFIQTWSPEHWVVRLAASQDYPAFFAQEIRSRKNQLYPPFCAVAGVGFTGENEAEVKAAARDFAGEFAKTAKEKFPKLPLVMLGPSSAEIPRMAGKYRQKLVLKCKNNADTRKLLAQVLEWFYTAHKNVNAYIDMHYDRM
jgi:primosomal protein N' (replication factor Y)